MAPKKPAKARKRLAHHELAVFATLTELVPEFGKLYREYRAAVASDEASEPLKRAIGFLAD